MDATDYLADVGAFADPFTDVRLRKVSGGAKIDLVRNGREISFQLEESSGRVSAKHRRKTFISVNSLLASEEFANLPRFAETIRRSIQTESKAPEIPSKILFEKKLIDPGDLLSSVPEQNTKTSIILLDGPAGVGKTYQLQKLAQRQSDQFLHGHAVAPLLHVSSKGRRLSNLVDVLALSTQDMAAAFTARHVPLLVRRGLLIVAIDGFDELVDADGYEDSWLALRQFLSEVGSCGVVVLAARDTFVEEQELLERIDRSKKEVSLSLAHVQLTSPADAKAWLSKAPNWKASELESDIASDLLAHGSYVLRPFFLRQLWDAKGWAEIADSGPREYLVNKFLRREANLIAQQVGGVTAELVLPLLRSLLGEVALEMANRETDSIEVEHLAFLTQFCFDGVLDDKSILKLVHKSGSMAFLEAAGTKQRRRFPHSEIEYFFLGGELFKNLQQGTVPASLRRNVLGTEQLEVFSEVMASLPGPKESVVQFLSAVRDSEIASDSFEYNASTLLLLAFAMGLIDSVQRIEAIEATFVGASPRGALVECEINRLDVCGANLADVEFARTKVTTLIVDDSTRVGRSLPVIESLEVRGGDRPLLEKDHAAIQSYLLNRSIEKSGDEGASISAVKLLDRVARRLVRHFYLREHDDDDGSVLLRDPEWDRVRRVLSKHQRLEVHRRKSMGGRPSALIRVKRPKELLDQSNRETRKIIEELKQ